MAWLIKILINPLNLYRLKFHHSRKITQGMATEVVSAFPGFRENLISL